MSATGLYAYAITRGLSPAELTDGVGIAGEAVRLVEHAGLAAVVSEVDLAEFGEEGLRRNLEDLGWLEGVALAHDDIARLVAARAPTAPLRLATIFLGEDSLRAQLAEWRDHAERVLDRIEGRSEWSVKVYSDPERRPPPPRAATGEPQPGAGRAYLMQRRAATRLREEAAEADASIAEQLHRALDAVATSGRRLPAQDKRLGDYAGEMILNGTYLLDDDRVEAFRATAAEVESRESHLRVQVGGPWPPYSFSSLDLS